MPLHQFEFLDDVTEVAPFPNGVDLRAGQPRVRVRAVGDGLFQVRLAQTGAAFEEPAFSYAVAPGFWDRPGPATDVVVDDAAIRVRSGDVAAVITRAPLRIHFEDASGHAFAADDFGMGWYGEKVRVWKRQAEGERFYGLGEKAAPLDRTGRAFQNWNTDYPGYRPFDDPLYKTFPFYLGLAPGPRGTRRAYGLFLDNPHRSHFDFGAQARGRVSFGADGGELVYYLLAGPVPGDVLRRYTALTGRMPLPPRWALGYHQSRWSYYPESDVRTLARQFRDRRIPLDVLHLDIHYMRGYRVFTWDAERFADPERLLGDLRAQGVRTIAIVDPGVKVDPGYDVHDEGLEAGAFVTYPDGTPYTGPVWPGDCHFPDFTKPSARAWFGAYYRRLLGAGVAGIWTDMNEPSVSDGATLPDLVLHDLEGRGGAHLEAHNLYGLLMARTTFEALHAHAPDERPFVITRSAYAGVQRYASVWTGDNVSSWEHLRLVLPMLCSLGLSGVPFAGSDVGGFLGVPTPELYARWVQVGALSPFFRTHTALETPRQEPWTFGPRVEAITRQYVELRYRLLPVFYTLFHEHLRTGLPVLRPLLLHYPDDERVLDLDDQVLLGAHVLAAPVLHEGQDARRVYLPGAGTAWYDFWTGRRYDGGQTVLVDAPLGVMPLFVGAGTTLPLAPVLQHTDERAVDTLDLYLFPGTGTSTLYEDDGHSHAYRDGDHRLTTFAMHTDGPGAYTLRRATEGTYRSPVTHFLLHVQDVEVPTRILVDGQALTVHPARPAADDADDANAPSPDAPQARYDVEARRLRLHVSAGFEQVRLTWPPASEEMKSQ